MRGEVCAGAWVYHYLEVPAETNSSASLDVQLVAYEGNIDYTVTLSHPPIRIAPPFGSAGIDIHEVDVLVCGVEHGTYYVGVRTAAGHRGSCAVYDIEPFLDTDHHNCTADRQAAPERQTAPQVLLPFIPVTDTVEPGAMRLFELEIDHSHEHDNLLIEVTQLSSHWLFESTMLNEKRRPICSNRWSSWSQ